MITDPLGTALKQIAEAKNLLEKLITSSETFDYPRAKVALKQLERKVRELGRLQGKYQRHQQANEPNIHVLDFKSAPSVAARSSD